MSTQPAKNYASFTFAEIRQATGATSGQEGDVLGVVTDSRQIEPGNLFIALKGEKFDGHDFLAQAKAIGAVTLGQHDADFIVPDSLKALGDLAAFHRNRFEVPVIAVTGSYGKTSTRALIEAGFAGHDILAAQGNFNNEIGLPMTLLGLRSEHKAAVLEMGMRGRGQIAYLAAIARPTIGVITNIGPQHIELLGTLEEIAAAKAELIESLPPEALAILPAEAPPLIVEFLKSKTTARITTFGTSSGADERVQDIRTEPNGNVSFSVLADWRVELPFPGTHNAVNAAAALAVFDAGYDQLGISLESVVANFRKATLPGARMRILKFDNGITVIDDCYNAGPDSMRAALQTLLDFPGGGRKIAILGAMRELGPHSEQEHVKVGRLAGQFVETLIGVDGDTRPLLNSAVAAAREVENEMEVHYSDNAAGAAERVGEWVRSGDVVLVKGSRSIGLEVVVEAVKGI
jgi:UDP-N-acetylmuramoyl-tripeptide--D-alanyl-D-alanine ligase